MTLRISWFDVVGRAVGDRPPKAIGGAVERLSAAYRSGGDLDFTTPAGRAAYLWHLVPAHVCDLARLFQDVPGLLGPERVTVSLVGLGAGPGTEVLALLDAITRVRERGGLPRLEEVRAVRVDRAGGWDRDFAGLLAAAVPLLQARDPGFAGDALRPDEGGDVLQPGEAGEAGEADDVDADADDDDDDDDDDARASDGVSAWTVAAPTDALVVDLAAHAPPKAMLEAIGGADLLVAANLLTEVAPRGTDDLPRGLGDALAAALKALRPGATALFADRAGAPGAAGRLQAVAALGQGLGLEVTGPRRRETKCGCALTRAAKKVYEHVRLPTTRHEDRPVANCDTSWLALARPAP